MSRVPPSQPSSGRNEQVDSVSHTILCPAKINLGLKVFPRRQDGYHDIDSWFVPLSLADVLTVTTAARPELVLTGMTAGITTEFANNLAGRAALAMGRLAGRPANVRIVIDKLIPTGGGLGGGSSDAAGAMLAIRQLWQLDVSMSQMADEALKLGSDVPFFIRRQSARCRGRGEQITHLHRPTPLFAVLIVPPQGISTAEVYRIFDAIAAPPPHIMAYDALINLPARKLDEAIFNDLQPAAFVAAPWLRELHKTAETAIGHRVHMSGSGSTLFALYDRADEVENAEIILREALGTAAQMLPVRVMVP
jgi:4-diphosphocytidyl-2-C-methyl-D-erythritol kinase